jgi:hypothetical protein
MRNRARNAAIGITLSIVLSLILFGTESVDLRPQVTGAAVYQEQPETIQEAHFKAIVEGKIYYYKFSDVWYESKDQIGWEERPDMGTTLFTGLYYLKSYDAAIYHDGDKITDFTEFARGLK